MTAGVGSIVGETIQDTPRLLKQAPLSRGEFRSLAQFSPCDTTTEWQDKIPSNKRGHRGV